MLPPLTPVRTPSKVLAAAREPFRNPLSLKTSCLSSPSPVWGAAQNGEAHGYTSHSLTQRRKPQNLDSREETAADRVADEIDS